MTPPVVHTACLCNGGVALPAVVLQGRVDETLGGVDTHAVEFAVAVVLGMFLGLERECSHKSAGIRTFALIGFLGVDVRRLRRRGPRRSESE